MNQSKLSLRPLKFREALRDLLQVKPEPKPPKQESPKSAKTVKSQARRSVKRK